VLSSRVDADCATNGLGETWELHKNGLKPYACGVVSHPTIDAMRRLRQSAGIPADDIAEVRAQVNPYVLELMGKQEPHVGLEGKFSIYHCAAIGYIDGAARVRQFSDDAVQRPEVVTLRRRFHPEVDSSLPISAARVQLRARDGREWEESVDAATGTPENPMTDDELIEKFLDLTSTRLPQERALAIAQAILDDASTPSAREVMAQVTGVPV
jgi:2-methylcitrate dehydratase PrpD